MKVWNTAAGQTVILYVGLGVAALVLLRLAPRLLPSLGEFAAETAGGVVKGAAGAAGSVVRQVSPTNRDNVFYGSVNEFGKAVSEDQNFTLGGWFYELVNGAYNPNALPVGARPTIPTQTRATR